MNKDKNSSIVYSTNPVFEKDQDNEMDMGFDGKQDLRIHLIRKGGGKIVTVIRGYKGNKKDLKTLGKYLQSSCSTGGTFKQNEIALQGDFREKVKNLLLKKGYNSKFSGG
ncbi:translation initiation factor [bacterium]|nr:MAG: translation initiation factor [bacterium]